MGITLALLADRRVRFQPEAGELAPGEWVRTPRGTTGEVLAHDADSGEALVRSLADPPRWAWFDPAVLVSEMDWE